MTPPAATLTRFDRLELSLVRQPWPTAVERRPEIDAYFADRQARQPALWNGRVLLLNRYDQDANCFRGAYFETDYASFLAWRDGGFHDEAVKNCFAAAALKGSDGGYLIGVMGSHTAGAGTSHFPCGTPDLDDVADGMVDLDHCVRREFLEETGLDIRDFVIQPGWTTVFDGPLIAHIKEVHAAEPAPVLRERALAHLASEAQPELDDIRIVYDAADLGPGVPRFVSTFLRHDRRDRVDE